MKFYQRLISTCMSMLFVATVFSYPSATAHHISSDKIDPDFLMSVMHSSKEEIVIITLKGDDAVSFSSRANQMNSTLEGASGDFLELNQDYINTLKDFQDHFISKLNNQIVFEVVHQYQVVLNGFAIRIRGYNIPLLKNYSQIEGIFSTRDLAKPDRKIAARTVHAATAWKMRDPSKNVPYDGRGVVIGIIDSGIDYYNAEFNREEIERPKFRDEYDFKPTDKILGGYDFSDNNEDFFDDFYTPHGTHVAGITSGNHPTNPNFKGMAPESNLFGYKVFSSEGATGANPANVIKAIDQSVVDKCHVINLSLGNQQPVSSIATDNPYYRATKNAVNAGVVVVASAGNNGSRHREVTNTLSSPGTFEPVIQVAASADRMVQNMKIVRTDGPTTSNQASHALHSPLFNPTHSGVEVVDFGHGTLDDKSRINVRGKIALISRGPQSSPITFYEKNINAKEAGAIGAIVYNYSNEQGRFGGILGNFSNPNLPDYIENPYEFDFIPMLFSNYITAEMIKKHVIDGRGRLEFPAQGTLTVSDFTSVGPCYSADDNIFKPEISAPGKQIRSTAVGSTKEDDRDVYTSYYFDSDGTSMSSPVVAGGVAVIRQARPTWTPEEIKAVIMNTADLMYNPITNETLSYFYQGAGHLNVASAIDSPVIVQPPSLMRNIKDEGESISFSVKNVYRNNVNLSIRAEVFSLHGAENPIDFNLNPSSLSVNQGQRSTFSLSFLIDKELFIERKYEGAIWIEVEGIERMNIHTKTIRIPFILYQNSLDTVDEPITHFSISESTLCNERMDQAEVSFRINSGSLLGITGDLNEKNYQNYAYELYVYAIDSSGEIWGEIFRGENMPVGNYSFIWDGKDIMGNEFLPDGNFQIQIMIDGTEYRISGGSVDITPKPFFSNPIPVIIQGSSIPQPPVLAFSAPSHVEVDQEFRLDIVFAEMLDINEIELTFNFSTYFDVVEIKEGNFIDQNNFDRSRHLREIRRDITVRASRDPQLSGDRSVVISLRMRARRRGQASFSLTNIIIKDKEGNNRKALIRMNPVDIHSQTDNLLIGDFNEDGVVDMKDFQMLANAFKTTFRDALWDERFDLNNDLIIDAIDLILFAKYYNKGN